MRETERETERERESLWRRQRETEREITESDVCLIKDGDAGCNQGSNHLHEIKGANDGLGLW